MYVCEHNQSLYICFFPTLFSARPQNCLRGAHGFSAHRAFHSVCYVSCELYVLWTVCVVCWVCCVLYILCAFHCACFPLKCGYRPALGCPTVSCVQFCDTFAVQCAVCSVQCAVCSVHKCAILHWAMCHVHCPLLSSWTGGHFMLPIAAEHFQVPTAQWQCGPPPPMPLLHRATSQEILAKRTLRHHREQHPLLHLTLVPFFITKHCVIYFHDMTFPSCLSPLCFLVDLDFGFSKKYCRVCHNRSQAIRNLHSWRKLALFCWKLLKVSSEESHRRQCSVGWISYCCSFRKLRKFLRDQGKKQTTVLGGSEEICTLHFLNHLQLFEFFTNSKCADNSIVLNRQ